MIQYAVTLIVTLKGRGVLDAPPSRKWRRRQKKSAGDFASGGSSYRRL